MARDVENMTTEEIWEEMSDNSVATGEAFENEDEEFDDLYDRGTDLSDEYEERTRN